MSQENVEIVRSGIDAYNRRDWDGMLENAAPDLVWDMSHAVGATRGVYGREELRSFLEDMSTTFDEHRFEAHEYIEAGENVVVPITAHAKGRDGIEAQAQTALVYTLRDGVVTRIVMYQALPEALEAAGLPE